MSGALCRCFSCVVHLIEFINSFVDRSKTLFAEAANVGVSCNDAEWACRRGMDSLGYVWDTNTVTKPIHKDFINVLKNIQSSIGKLSQGACRLSKVNQKYDFSFFKNIGHRLFQLLVQYTVPKRGNEP